MKKGVLNKSSFFYVHPMENVIIKLQEFLGTKPIMLIGTGLSISMGLPGMWELSQYLDEKLPEQCETEKLAAEWKECSQLIADHGLEDGLGKKIVSPELLTKIVSQTATLVSERDSLFRNTFFSNSTKNFPLSKLLRHLIDSLHPSNRTLEIITSNYDHLIEYACDHLGVSCSTGFQGSYVQQYSDNSLRNPIYTLTTNNIAGKGVANTPKQINQVRLFKPHGSLNWQRINGEIFQCSEILQGSQRVIITPGIMKYLESMNDNVMNTHRESANETIRKADSIFILGYGFNDSHLQTQLFSKLKSGMKCLILTKKLTPSGIQIVNTCPQIMALEEDENNGTIFHHQGNKEHFPINIWELSEFISTVI